jgi:hypothetical protein
MHFKLFESRSGLVLIGAEPPSAYRYQDSDFSTDKTVGIVGEDHLVSKRNCLH